MSYLPSNTVWREKPLGEEHLRANRKSRALVSPRISLGSTEMTLI